jgi:hypothetical protein
LLSSAAQHLSNQKAIPGLFRHAVSPFGIDCCSVPHSNRPVRPAQSCGAPDLQIYSKVTFAVTFSQTNVIDVQAAPSNPISLPSQELLSFSYSAELKQSSVSFSNRLAFFGIQISF